MFSSPLYFWTISSRIKAFIEWFYCIAEKDCVLLMTAADNFFWMFEQAVSHYIQKINGFETVEEAFVRIEDIIAALEKILSK